MPNIFIEACTRVGISVFAIAYNGNTDKTPCCAHEWVNVGDVGKAISIMKTQGVRDIVMIGGMKRPSFRSMIPDAVGARLLSRIGFRWSGDNAVLLEVSKFLEEEGFCIKSVQDIFPSVIETENIVGDFVPDDIALCDIKMGAEFLSAASRFDFGQGVAVQNGLIIAIEAAEGTDACILRCGGIKRKGDVAPVYIKAAKNGQDDRLDLPVIGPNTMDCLLKAGFRGIAFLREMTLFISPQIVIQKANKNGIFLYPF